MNFASSAIFASRHQLEDHDVQRIKPLVILTCTSMQGALEVVAVVFGGVVRVALVEGGVGGRPVHHLLAVHHVAHGGLRAVGAAGARVREY